MDANLGYGVLHDFLVFHIALVTNEQLVDPFCCVAIDFLKPLLHVVERVHVSHVVNNTDAMGATIIRRCDGPETFLTCCVPLYIICQL